MTPRAGTMRLACMFSSILLFGAAGLLLFISLQDPTELAPRQLPGEPLRSLTPAFLCGAQASWLPRCRLRRDPRQAEEGSWPACGRHQPLASDPAVASGLCPPLEMIARLPASHPLVASAHGPGRQRVNDSPHWTLLLGQPRDPSNPAPPAWAEGVQGTSCLCEAEIASAGPHCCLPPPAPREPRRGVPFLTCRGLLGTGGRQQGQSGKDGSGASGRPNMETGSSGRVPAAETQPPLVSQPWAWEPLAGVSAKTPVCLGHGQYGGGVGAVDLGREIPAPLLPAAHCTGGAPGTRACSPLSSPTPGSGRPSPPKHRLMTSRPQAERRSTRRLEWGPPGAWQRLPGP